MTKIAIIDDNLVFRKVTSILLKKLGVTETCILLFKNGNEIQEFMHNHCQNINKLPDMLLLDLNMPIMDGWEFLEWHETFKNKYQYNPKIYILTSSVDEKDYKNAMKYSIVEGYLTKPINERELAKIINIKE